MASTSRLHRLVPHADALLAAGFCGLVVVELLARMDDGYQVGRAWWNAPLLLITTAALAWRGRRPIAAFAAGYAPVVITSLFAAHTIFFFGTLMPLLVLSYGAARVAARRLLPAIVTITALPLVVVPLHQPAFDAGDYLFWAMLGGSALALGVVMRRLDRHRAALVTTLAEQVLDQDLRERALLLDERRRIARELHDVVAHAVSLMVVQAGAARLAVGTDDGQARTSLRAVEQAGRDALLDLRRLLGVLEPEEDATPTAPAPGLHLLPELISRMRRAGLDIRVEGSAPADLPAGLDQSLYRIAQESLTNVLKHAGPTDVLVRFGDDDATLALEVSDSGPAIRRARVRTDGGHGVVGMRERAAVFGGRFEAGPSGDGWRVAVSIPWPIEAARVTPVPAP
jgi:signal transduction histidine kinase